MWYVIGSLGCNGKLVAMETILVENFGFQGNINGFQSSIESVTCGFPQGSILGHLLFVYVNDMATSVSSELVLYGDDSALLVSGKLDVSNKLSLHLGKQRVYCLDQRTK